MDERDETTIKQSLPTLTKSLYLNEHFFSLLLEYRIFSQEMINDIKKNENPPLELCLMLLRRGPQAYNNFVKALKDSNQTIALHVLEQTRIAQGFPPHIVSRPTNDIPTSRRLSNSETSFLENESSSPTVAEYRRRVLDPPNYFENPPSPLPLTSMIDSIPSTYTIGDINVKCGNEVRGIGQDVYPNRGRRPRGFALIINYERFTNATQRIGSEKDVVNLDLLLYQLGYTVTLKTNLTLRETIAELDDFTQAAFHSEADSTIVAIMSHGKSGSQTDGTLIFTSDGRHIGSEEILRRFNNVNCPSLKGKPKIFIFQFCRGDAIDYGRPLDCSAQGNGKTVTDGRPLVSTTELEYERSFDDMLIVYSTIPGYVSYREEEEGTWLVKALCLVFMEEAYQYHIDRLFQRVDQLVKRWTGTNSGKQTLEIARRGFNKKFYLNPGIWVS